MSILSALQTFLSGYSQMSIQTDIIGKDPGSYAIAPTGNSKSSEDILGNKTFENNYVFYAKELTSNEIDRKENQDFLENFQDWIDEQITLPSLSGSYKVIKMSVSNALLFDVSEDGLGVYQVQIKLIIKKEVQ